MTRLRYLYDRSNHHPGPDPHEQDNDAGEGSADVRRRPAPSIPSLFATQLRAELSERALDWARQHGYAHEPSRGSTPAVLFREQDGCHGNFFDPSFRAIQARPEWHRRLAKMHSSYRRAFLDRDREYRELDSSNSSDALLMNIFCAPEILPRPALRSLLGTSAEARIDFGYKPRIPLTSGRSDATETDLRIGDLLIEAKLTEYDFQAARWPLVRRYRDLAAAFEVEELEVQDDKVQSYQLVRGVLAAVASGGRYCVLCDARRPDLIARWFSIIAAVRAAELRSRLVLLTWQELAATLPLDLQQFLLAKYGIAPTS